MEAGAAAAGATTVAGVTGADNELIVIAGTAAFTASAPTIQRESDKTSLISVKELSNNKINAGLNR